MAVDKSRKLLNRVIARKLRYQNGLVIEHANIKYGISALFRKDGVHFSDMGNDIWLSDITKGSRDWLQL